MNLDVHLELQLDFEKVSRQVIEAAEQTLKETIVEVAHEAIEGSRWKTGNNRRSIFFGVTGMDHRQALGEGKHPGDTWTGPDRSVLDESKVEGAVYSTSGYGGYLETGTVKMAARPYFKPALDHNFTQEKFVEAMRKKLP